MGKRKLILVLVTGAAFALSASLGPAALSAGTAKGTSTYPTTVDFLSASGVGSNWIAAGRLDTVSRCRHLRKVTLYRQTSSGYTRVDQILSSARGAWAFRFRLDPSESAQFKITVTSDVRDDGNVVCEADTYKESLGPSPRAGRAASSAGVGTGTTAYPTKIHLQGWGGTIKPTHADGQLDTSERCLGLRKVRMYVQTSSGYKRVDTILSSARGAWAFLYEPDASGTTQVRFTVSEDTRSHGTITCERRTKDEELVE